MSTVILYLPPPTPASTRVTLFGGSGIVNFDTSMVQVPTSRLTGSANAGGIEINNARRPEMIEAVRDMTALLFFADYSECSPGARAESACFIPDGLLSTPRDV